MEFSRAGQALLRSRWRAPEPCLKFLLRTDRPSLPTWHKNNAPNALRAFSSSYMQSQQASAPAPKPEENDSQAEPTSADTGNLLPANETTLNRHPQKSDSLRAKKKPNAFDDLLYSYSSTSTPSGRNSAEEAQKAFLQSREQAQPKFADWGGTMQPSRRLPRRVEEPMRQYEQNTKFSLAMDEFNFSENNNKPDTRGTATNVSYNRYASMPVEYPRLEPNLGRHIEVAGGDLPAALRKLNIMVAVNRIKSQSLKQRFHERPGLKRKRLKSERWRRRFRDGFHHVTGRVARFVGQGW